MLNVGFWNCVGTSGWTRIPVDVDLLIQGLFVAAAVMVSFGALIGKVHTVFC